MFLCEKCHKDSGYTCFHVSGSTGPCEGCGEVRSCSDCSAYKRRLPASHGLFSPKGGDEAPRDIVDPKVLRDAVRHYSQRIPDLPVSVPRTPAPADERCPRCFAPRGAVGCSSCQPAATPWDPESLREMFPDGLSESFGRALLDQNANEHRARPPKFGTK